MTTERSESDRTTQANALLATSKIVAGGQLKVFLGAAPGVGKTYAMLSAARELKRQGVDVVIGVVETHGRPETEAMLAGLEILPRKISTYREHQLAEFDIEAMLARKPKIALMDELAHSNAPGSRHEYRYQDIAELLDAGIDVYSTVNVQHLESLNDLVLKLTGVRVRETVPDKFFDRARDVVLVDLPPRELIERLKQGKVYMPEQAASALNSFFSASNLTALRDLAVQQVADHVDSDLREHLAARGLNPVPIRARVLVAIDGQENSEYLVRAARKLAERRNAPWTVVFVATPSITGERQNAVAKAFALARRLGAETTTLYGSSIVDQLLAFASSTASSAIVIARTRERPLMRILNRTLTQRLLQKGAQFELTILNTPYAKPQNRGTLRLGPLQLGTLAIGSWQECGFATLVAAIAVLLGLLAEHFLNFNDVSTIFLTAVLLVATRSRLGVAFYTAGVCFLAYNFFFTNPRFSFSIDAHQDVIKLTLFFLTAMVCSRLAATLRAQVLSLSAANAHASTMQKLGQKLATAADEVSVLRAGAKLIHEQTAGEVVVLLRDAKNLEQSISEPGAIELSLAECAAADWSYTHAKNAGRFTDTLNALHWWFTPIVTHDKPIGVLALRMPSNIEILLPELEALIHAIVVEMGQTLARTRLTEALESARRTGETEQLRSALLASVSHDLRSPLASIVGSAESLTLYQEALSLEDKHELASGILQEGKRLDRYIQNLLDMTRLGHGTLQINRDWISAAEIVGSATLRLRKQLPKLLIEIDVPASLPPLYVHPALIEQALFNVLENGAHYTPEDKSLRIVARVNEGKIEIDVIDQGPGIPEDQRQRIFDIFYSLERGDRGRQGTGMGLTICQGMIGAHGGTVEAFAGPDNVGTIVRISLPIAGHA